MKRSRLENAKSFFDHFVCNDADTNTGVKNTNFLG